MSAFRKGILRKGNKFWQNACHKQVVETGYPWQLCFSSLQISTEEKYGGYRALSLRFSTQHEG